MISQLVLLLMHTLDLSFRAICLYFFALKYIIAKTISSSDMDKTKEKGICGNEYMAVRMYIYYSGIFYV